MKLRLIDGDANRTYDFEIQGRIQVDEKGKYVKIGSYRANYWFHVSAMKTEKGTLNNAKKHLLANLKRNKAKMFKFEYINEKAVLAFDYNEV